MTMATDLVFRRVARLGLVTASLMFALIVIGAVVRATGSGLSCPDWPLCQGRLVPPLEPHVLIEWFHRLVALLLGVLLVTTTSLTLARRELRSRLGVLAGFAVALYATQAMLGALTVWKFLSPAIVSLHLAVGVLMFATLLVFTLVARREAAGSGARRVAEGGGAGAPHTPGLQAAFAIGTGLAYGQMLLGALVSTNHAGLACPDWPTCYGQWFPPLRGLVGLQMLHRLGAYALTGWLVFLAVAARRAPDPGTRASAAFALGLTLVQVALGVCNVLLGTPAWLSAAHLATATAILATLVTATFRLTASAPGAPRLEGAVAR